jgi:hypothetical protein
MLDFLGQIIHAGDTIVYPNRHGSQLWMNRAVVTEAWDGKLRIRREDGQHKVIRRVDRVVVVTEQVR